MEILTHRAPGQVFQYAVFDFDGTLSLIREGWQNIMIPYFTDALCATPRGRDMDLTQLAAEAREFVFVNTGKQTIYQCIELAQRVADLGGEALDPQDYKDEFSHRLLQAIDRRLAGLADGSVSPDDLMVPGSAALLEMLRRRGVAMYLASGTDEADVLREAALLGIDGYFGGHIHGAQRDYKTFSKKMVIDRILRENHLSGEGLLGFGDGYVEIENVKSVGGYACGVASNEATRQGIDQWKRTRLMGVGADLILPDYRELDALEAYLFG